ncbi:MAG TPA: hypothetical protein VJG90_03335 [Candidatus Nanoarchaeia archaeon]|nr:hypothetical protein [Candidatus Nanoarchaeia archaeon]
MPYEAFPRPSTLLNRLLSRVSYGKTLHHFGEFEIASWQGVAKAAYHHFVETPSILERVVEEASWEISADDPPQNT